MIKVVRVLCVCIVYSMYAIERYPVDVCCMVADLKYNAKQGIKICEIQQACLSVFNGNSFQNPQEESIHKELLAALSLYNQHGWIVGDSIADKNLVSTLASSPSWQNPKNIIALFSDSYFTKQAKQPVSNIYDLSSYQGFLYVNWSQFCAIHDFETRLPGIIIIDKSSFPFWIDKYQMTQLFAQDELLSSFKPKWGHYKKNYTKELAAQIAHDLQCDTFVIKPRGEFMGKGVIITQKENLDDVLYYIITQQGPLADSTNPSYTAWKKDSFDSFIVEEFVSSDPIAIPHLDNHLYQPTMRVAFVLVYNKGNYHVHFLGQYWKTPAIALDEEGDFMQKNKDICKPPYYCAVDEQTVRIVQQELSIALPILHKKMLEFDADPQESYASRRNIQIVLQETNK